MWEVAGVVHGRAIMATDGLIPPPRACSSSTHRPEPELIVSYSSSNYNSRQPDMFPRTHNQASTKTGASYGVVRRAFDRGTLPGSSQNPIDERLKIAEETLQGDISDRESQAVLLDFLTSQYPDVKRLSLWATRNNQCDFIVCTLEKLLPDERLYLPADRIVDLRASVVNKLENRNIEVSISVSAENHEFDGEHLLELDHRLKAIDLRIGGDTPEDTVHAIVDALKHSQISRILISVSGESSRAGPDLLNALKGLPLEKLDLEGEWTEACIAPLAQLFQHKVADMDIFGENFRSCSIVLDAILQAGDKCILQALSSDLTEDASVDDVEQSKYVNSVDNVIRRNLNIRTMQFGGVKPDEICSAVEENHSLEHITLFDTDEDLNGACQQIRARTANNRRNHRQVELVRPHPEYAEGAAFGAIKSIFREAPSNTKPPKEVMESIARFVVDDNPSLKKVHDYALTGKHGPKEAKEKLQNSLVNSIGKLLKAKRESSLDEVALALKAQNIQLTETDVATIRNSVLADRDDLLAPDFDVLLLPATAAASRPDSQQPPDTEGNSGLKRDRGYPAPERFDRESNNDE